MLNLKFADAYVDLSLRRDKYDSGMKKLQRDLNAFAGTKTVTIALNTAQFAKQMVAVRQELSKLRAFPIRLTVDRAAAAASLNLMRQQMRTLTQRGGTRIRIDADLRGWRRSIVSVFTDLNRVRMFAATIPIKVNATPAHASVNLLMQQLRAAQALTKFQLTAQRGAGFGMWRMGGGGQGGLGGFVQGLGMGAGLPLTLSPAMMAGQMLAAGTIGTVKTAAGLESEFAVLRRITGLTADQMGKFKSTLMDMANTRPGVSTQDLLEMSQVGARMGVADKGGAEGLETFTEQLARVRLVVNDIPTEELANRIGRILNVFELGTDRVAGFGSALTAMDNISTASAKDILDITTRLSGTGKAIGLTLPQITAMASVLKDVGLSNEVAGTAFSQIFRKMATDSENFAKQIGMDAKKFADAYRRDPMEALGLVIRKFRELDDSIASQEFLDTLGLKGQRTAASLQQLASKFDEVGRRAAIASSETGTTAALGGAESIMGGTTGATFTRAKNSITDLADAAGTRLAPLARAGADALSDVAGALASIIRGTNQVSFAAPGRAAKAALAALPATNAGRKLPVADVDEAEKAVASARAAAAAAEMDANEKAAAARRLGFDARRAMAGARTPEQADAAMKMFGGVEAAEKGAADAAKAMAAAGVALKEALAALKLKKDELAAKDAEQAKKNAVDNAIFNAKAAVGGVLGAVAEVRQGLLGAGGRALAQVVPRVPHERQLGGILSGAEVGQRIQADIFAGRDKKDKGAEEAARNTKPLAGLLSEIKAVLQRGGAQAGAAILPP